MYLAIIHGSAGYQEFLHGVGRPRYYNTVYDTIGYVLYHFVPRPVSRKAKFWKGIRGLGQVQMGDAMLLIISR